jgi:hypothetical protein
MKAAREDAVYLGLIEYNPSESKPRLIAKSNEVETGWHFTTREQFRALIDKKSDLLLHRESNTNWHFLVSKLLGLVNCKNLCLPMENTQSLTSLH